MDTLRQGEGQYQKIWIKYGRPIHFKGEKLIFKPAEVINLIQLKIILVKFDCESSQSKDEKKRKRKTSKIYYPKTKSLAYKNACINTNRTGTDWCKELH